MYRIGNSAYFDLALDGQTLPITNGNMYDALLLDTHAQVTPSLKVRLIDPTGELLRTIPIADGQQLTLTMGANSDTEQPESINFRVCGIPNSASYNTSAYITLYGLLDVPQYRSVTSKSYQGNTSDVITQLAADCGLTADVHTTNDSQIWRGALKPFYKFAQHIAYHGWADENSTMLMGVTPQKILRYYNMDNIINGTAKAVFYQGQQTDTTLPGFMVHDRTMTNVSGILNHWNGYGSQTNQIGSNGALNINQIVNAKRMSNYLEIGETIKSAIGLVRSEYMPFDGGNGHPNYAIAKHQNRKGKALFANAIHCMVKEKTGLDKYDLVKTEFHMPGGQLDTAYSGFGVVSARARYIKGNDYFERVVIDTQGRNSEISGTMV